MNTTQTTDNTPKTARKIDVGNFGNGRYSPAMDEVYGDIQDIFGYNELQSHMIAAQVGRDAGVLDNQKVSLKASRPSGKDFKMSLKAVSDAVKINATPALTILALCAELDKLFKVGLAGKGEMKLSKNLDTWVNSISENVEAYTEAELKAIENAKHNPAKG